MPTYTILGGTGSTGRAVLKGLIANPPHDLTLKIYVRSRSRLLSTLPSLSEFPNTTIIEGSLTSPEIISQCLKDTNVVFSCIATNTSEPGMDIAISTAALIISTLKTIQAASPTTYNPPTILILSSNSVNPTLKSSHPPAPLFALLKLALHYLYADLEAAESLYRTTLTTNPGLLVPIFVQPPGIMPGEVPTGYVLSTEKSSATISYADLGLAMLEIAEKREGWEEWKGKGVTTIATGEVKQDWRANGKELLRGLWAYLFPGVWRWGRQRSWW